MQYVGMPAGMWLLFQKSFSENLVTKFGYARKEAAEITQIAKKRY